MIDWNKYLLDLHNTLLSKGYSKYKQNYKSEDFSYWKTFDNKSYQVGLLIYDFRQYIHLNPISCNRVSIQYECMILGDSSINMSISNQEKNINAEKFEEIAKDFYLCMNKYNL